MIRSDSMSKSVTPESPSTDRVHLDVSHPIWNHFFLVAPLIVVGTREEDGRFDLAAKHMAMPMGWENYFGFVCTPDHGTYHNVRREQCFTISFPRPDQVLATSLTAAPRCGVDSKPSLAALRTFPASTVEGVLLEDAYLYLECRLDRIVDGFGRNSLIVGEIVAAQADRWALRVADRDEQDVIAKVPLLVYLAPGRWAKVDQSFSFPFHAGFKR